MGSITNLYTSTGREVPMRVIVCGLPRTGTMSMRKALHQLGVYRCYHMVSVIGDLDSQADLWVRAFRNKYGDESSSGTPWTREQWDEILGTWQATADMPAVVFSVELAKAYPEAKVIVMRRDPDKWYASVSNTILKAMKPTTAWGWIVTLYCAAFDSRQRSWIRLGMTMDRYLASLHDKEAAVAWFHGMYREFEEGHPGGPQVRDEATGELVEAPFPRSNDGTEWLEQYDNIRGQLVSGATWNLINWTCRLATAAGLAYAVWTWAGSAGSGEL
ncbi:hypothetical protein NLG97_g6543 [Lecanicillium saksenae]|uniref:Uncharacterized protein n=1 Tax=Lecanicillium saksenae TaxID=468837 RepID=A0ACC1QR12_9HYPO|nr:hypothetical protein NLG97_g6543 [Lecanicillium saksenae]